MNRQQYKTQFHDAAELLIGSLEADSLPPPQRLPSRDYEITKPEHTDKARFTLPGGPRNKYRLLPSNIRGTCSREELPTTRLRPRCQWPKTAMPPAGSAMPGRTTPQLIHGTKMACFQEGQGKCRSTCPTTRGKMTLTSQPNLLNTRNRPWEATKINTTCHNNSSIKYNNHPCRCSTRRRFQCRPFRSSPSR